ncbi:hypothetical protein [Dongshaea marina]|uniref:hypothetical protein n=1 Tax=Dongshaea marina TaxID=2047966 RepID=UPI0018FFDDFD|nr:hypothetical protein [Dongshaea marina]
MEQSLNPQDRFRSTRGTTGVIYFCQFFWAMSFYGLWSLLPIYLNKSLHMDEELSFAIFGGYAALGAALLFVGAGWLTN